MAGSMNTSEREMKNEMYVYLGIEQFDNDPEEITNLVGLQPTSISRIGDPIGKSKLKCKHNYWAYRVDAKDNFELEYLIREVLSKFENKEKLKEAIGLGKGYIVCVLFDHDTEPSLEISSELMQEIAELKCAFWLDFYPFGVK